MLILVPHVYILQLNRSAVLKCLLLTERVTAYKPAGLMHILSIKGLDRYHILNTRYTVVDK